MRKPERVRSPSRYIFLEASWTLSGAYALYQYAIKAMRLAIERKQFNTTRCMITRDFHSIFLLKAILIRSSKVQYYPTALRWTNLQSLNQDLYLDMLEERAKSLECHKMSAQTMIAMMNNSIHFGITSPPNASSRSRATRSPICYGDVSPNGISLMDYRKAQNHLSIINHILSAQRIIKKVQIQFNRKLWLELTGTLPVTSSPLSGFISVRC